MSRPRSKLDRAIIASVTAMLGMNLFFLVQQVQASPLLVTAGKATEAALA